MNKTLVSAAAFGAVLFGCAAVGFAAAPQSVAEIANYRDADRQSLFEEGAKKEGKVMVYTTGTQTQPIFEALGKKYPFIRIEIFRGPTPDATRRALEESKAGRPIVDVFDFNTGGMNALLQLGLMQPYWSPEMAAYRDETVQPGRNWVIDYESYLSLGYNTKALSEKDIPKTYDDLLDPKWKGKFSVSARGTTFAQWVGVLVIEKGEDFVKKLGGQQFKLHQISARALASLMVSEEVPISPTIFSAHVRNDKESGAPVAWRALGPVFANNVSMALPAKTSHPHAGLLVIDFMMSIEGQLLRQRLGYASPRKDMPAIEKPEKVYQLPERPDFERETERWTNLVKQTFR